MIAQQHKILRQVLEIRGCPPEEASRIRSDLREVYYRRLLPAIERICSDLGASDLVHRIDTLEIDLGEVPLDAIESALAERFDETFGRELAAAIGGAPQADSELEVFRWFIRTGTLPWWADPSDRGLLESGLDSLARRAPRVLRREMQALRDRESVQRRVARAYPDRLLDELAGATAPALAAACPGMGSAWLDVLGSAMRARGHAAHDIRNLWWEELLRAAAAGDAAASEAPRFFRAVLVRVARRLGRDYGALVADLRRALEERHAPWLREIVEGLRRDAGTEGGAAPSSPGESARAELARLLARPATASAPVAGLQAQLHALIHQLPAALRAQALGALRSERNRGGGAEDPSPAAIRALAELVRDAAPEPDAAPEEHAPADLSFSDTGEIYVGNAGLVILWPFLEPFFARLGLVGEKRFRDEAAAQRAAGLLQYVAAADALPPEPLLPLNKVLCGLAPETVFDFGAEITAKEIEECDDLLAAVIQQAPVLRDMSADGFRGSFLLRKGQLGARDGNWLLRVERETHDVVLDRFPWGVGFVKLPWMETMMQVEW